MIKTIHILLFIMAALHAYSQTAEVYGQVFSNGEAIPYAAVSIHDTKLAVLTDTSGYFELKGIHPGQFKLDIQAIGYEIAQISVQIQNGEKKRTQYHFAAFQQLGR
jgi:hypothetical protein